MEFIMNQFKLELAYFKMLKAFAASSFRLNQEIHKKIDVFAFAVMLFEMISGESAWKGLSRDRISSAVINNERPILKEPTIKSTHPVLIEIVQQGWQPDPQDRPSFNEIQNLIVRIVKNCYPNQNIDQNGSNTVLTYKTITLKDKSFELQMQPP